MKPSPSQMLMDSGSLVNSLIHWLLNTVHLAAGITDQTTGTSECSLHWRAQDSKYRLPLFSRNLFWQSNMIVLRGHFIQFRPPTLGQGPLITDGRNCCKWTSPLVVLAKTFTMVKISVQNF